MKAMIAGPESFNNVGRIEPPSIRSGLVLRVFRIPPKYRVYL